MNKERETHINSDQPTGERSFSYTITTKTPYFLTVKALKWGHKAGFLEALLLIFSWRTKQGRGI
jgi:hypothetical protein